MTTPPALALASAMLAATGPLAALNPAATEVWAPQPPEVTPGEGDAPPSDAVVLFDGRSRDGRSLDGGSLDGWVSTNHPGEPARWRVHDGVLTVAKGTGNIQTRRAFRDYQLHLEWRIPAAIHGAGQLRGNSGLFLASTGPGDAGYEVQILDCWHNPTYVNGQAASLYKQSAPLVNACRPPGQWQSYDVIWVAPRFDAAGHLVSPARVTLFHNRVLVQNAVALRGPTLWIGQPTYAPHGPAPIKLQDHMDPSEPISFRNIWLREIPGPG